jgi:hypothetical protein
MEAVDLGGTGLGRRHADSGLGFAKELRQEGRFNPAAGRRWSQPRGQLQGREAQQRSHVSRTDPDARLYKNSEGDKAQRCVLGHALMENRTIAKSGATLGADNNYDTKDFVATLGQRKVTPHVASKEKGSAIDRRTSRHDGYRTSLKVRKRLEEVFGWAKTVGPLRQTKFRGLKKVAAQTVFTFAAYKLTRMSAIFGWRCSTA